VKLFLKMLLLASVVVFAMTALSAQPTMLLAGSFCVSMPTKDEDFGKNWGVTSTSDIKIDLVALTPQEERDMDNFNTKAIFSKIMCVGHAQKTRSVAFTVPGIERFFDTSPRNIVEKSVKEGPTGYAGLDSRPLADATTWTAKATTTPIAEATKSPAPNPTQYPITPTNVISAITGDRWTSESLIVSGTLTNSSAVAVQITGIDAIGFNKDQKIVTRGSDFTIFNSDMAPGEVVNFKVELKDDAKQVKFVQVFPTWTQ
jgi:hypothetical protein